MEKIFILGRKEETLKQSGFQFEIIPSLINDTEINDWVILLFKKNEIDKLIIDLSADSNLLLKISLHIRLSLNELRAKSLIPIIFISTSSLYIILKENHVWSHILTTGGVYFSSFQQIKEKVHHSEGLLPKDYKMNFLDYIVIPVDERIGRHSLSNIWGAYAMDKASGVKALKNNKEFNQFSKKLYFKYIKAFNFDLSLFETSSVRIVGSIILDKPSITIDATGRKILLIDDEASKGWESVLRKVFKTSSPDDFTVIEEKIDYYDSLSKESKDIIENKAFDLYLIDLRLNGIQEDNIIDTCAFSGMSVLKKIKELNQGNQVIMFTASNKAWNQKAFLDAGADGYYMKESPEYNFSDELSLQNYNSFRDEVALIFRMQYLKEVFDIHKKCIRYINLNKVNKESKYKKFYERTLTQLEIAFELLKLSKEEKYLNLSFLTYYRIVEDYSKQVENFKYDELKGFYVGNELVIDKEKKKRKLKFKEKEVVNESYPYFEINEEDIEYENPTVLAKVSFILVYKHHKDNPCLKEWGRLNYLRNTVAVHGGSNRTVTTEDLKSLLGFVELFLINS